MQLIYCNGHGCGQLCLHVFIAHLESYRALRCQIHWDGIIMNR